MLFPRGQIIITAKPDESNNTELPSVHCLQPPEVQSDDKQSAIHRPYVIFM